MSLNYHENCKKSTKILQSQSIYGSCNWLQSDKPLAPFCSILEKSCPNNCSSIISSKYKLFKVLVIWRFCLMFLKSLILNFQRYLTHFWTSYYFYLVNIFQNCALECHCILEKFVSLLQFGRSFYMGWHEAWFSYGWRAYKWRTNHLVFLTFLFIFLGLK